MKNNNTTTTTKKNAVVTDITNRKGKVVGNKKTADGKNISVVTSEFSTSEIHPNSNSYYIEMMSRLGL